MKLKLVDKQTKATNTRSFIFENKDAATSNWLPGQYIYITLPKLNYPDDRGETRHFTISSSSTEKNITITTRIRQESGYKKTLDEMQIGDELEGRGPQGSFVLDEKIKENVFIAGGIGITPFRSMIKYTLDKKLDISQNLIFSNSDSEFVFKDELDNWSSINTKLKINYINTKETGHLDSKKLQNILNSMNLVFLNQTFWVVGPNSFVDTLESILIDNLKIKEENVRTEKFTGY